jgi:hypothetical protein
VTRSGLLMEERWRWMQRSHSRFPGGAGDGPLFSRLWTCGGPGDSFVRYRRLCIDTTSSITAMDPNAQRSAISREKSLLCHIVAGSQ